MNTAQHIASKTAQEFKVKLCGAYQGNYRVFVICCNNGESEFLVFTDTPVLVHIHNQDITDLVKQTIQIK
jgi:hypothetical protein